MITKTMGIWVLLPATKNLYRGMLMKTLTSFKCQKIQAKSDVIRENTSIKSITTEEVKGTGNTIAATCHHLIVYHHGVMETTLG